MAETEPNWEWYRSFVAVLETGSLSAAGRALGMAQPTVGRHVDSLEAALQLKLFTRSFDGFAPTDAALELKPYAASLAATAAALRRVATSHGDGVRGTVRLTASEIVSSEVLPPILADLREAHPELVIELVPSNKVENLLRRDADIAVRMAAPSQDALVARRVATIEVGLHAHRRYLERHGTPRTLAELAQHALIGWDTETAYIRRFQERFPQITRDTFAFRTDSDVAQLAAIRAGLGVGFCQARLAARDPDMVRLFRSAVSLHLETWIAMHADLRDSPRCAVTFAALVEGLAAYARGG
ncbi:MAG: LysR family transcriptional regulator [Burkholderiaceae bacterium]